MAASGRKLRKSKSAHSTLLEAMAQTERRPRILYSQARAEARDHGARHAAVGGPMDASVPLQNQGVDNADAPASVPGSSPGNAKPSR